MKESVFELIRQAEILNNESIIRFMNLFSGNLSVSHCLVLNELKEKGPQKPSELARKLNYTPGALTGISTKLINEGYAVRQYDKADRRIARISITEAGIDILKIAQKAGHELRADLYSVLSDEEINQLLVIQKKLLNHLLSKK
ncbi:MarR family winged helix-turn-helix transcriptional regulator [Chungangia koreensis]|uniref:MarR family winged helix-turn-helix transcriptional regulator n=1 Tax=Chungangia koreensis TaxID=752657 RepID=A0ABV8X749_9LACT